MPTWARAGLSVLLMRSSSTGTCSRNRGNSLLTMGTISKTMLSKATMNSTSTSTTASSRGSRPPPTRSSQSTSGVSA